MSLLVVEGLDVTFPGVRAVRGASFTLDAGECLAIVGESGSGKSVTARSLVGLAGDTATVRAGTLSFDGRDLTGVGEAGWRRVRGREIGLVLQDALVSLDPLRTVGAEIGEALRVHGVVDRAERPARVRELLTGVGVPEPDRRARQHPHQLSGGLRQRALIASALAARPRLLIADEPTTALDVTVQAQVLRLLRGLKDEGTALLLISHDLSVVAGIADRIAVMYGGVVVEHGPVRDVLEDPCHPYTQALIAAVPGTRPRGVRLSTTPPDNPAPGPDGCPFAARCARADDRCRTALPEPVPGPRCWYPAPAAPVPVDLTAAPPPVIGEPLVEVVGVSKRFRAPDRSWYDAVKDVSFTLRRGETLGLVGESGSGKTTAARIALGFTTPDAGEVRFLGERWSGLPERARRARRTRIQTVHQDPLGSFDPRYTVRRLIAEAVARTGRRGRDRRDRVAELLDQVGLSRALLDRRPRELSGGQRQRVSVARALGTEPDVLVCDEPVSALDVSVQAQILDLLLDLRRETGAALLFISHDLGVVRHVSDRVAVMTGGGIVETGPVDDIFDRPAHPYTRELLAATAIPVGVPGR
ncbi:ABC transporter ATP-binding protein [Actinosynnema sp. NPDC047251]|uniref:ABC-type transporter, ATPase subunit n=1 Tax=Saccharothrix espanaensis (strain ATCC 51144 / DSM 44229 / JCM 9112 / NBRC 15066 / NRRL 15764) TaxID=1179773 RepID=K0K629_SACES|nr:ABC transporter ATP-binding protein [Saccharothrix espanaensis]CCH32008.1 ABC-type transporter, ATPase subunit [Saccharothrix espanaensis DSM 44229]